MNFLSDAGFYTGNTDPQRRWHAPPVPTAATTPHWTPQPPHQLYDGCDVTDDAAAGYPTEAESFFCRAVPRSGVPPPAPPYLPSSTAFTTAPAAAPWAQQEIFPREAYFTPSAFFTPALPSSSSPSLLGYGLYPPVAWTEDYRGTAPDAAAFAGQSTMPNSQPFPPLPDTSVYPPHRVRGTRAAAQPLPQTALRTPANPATEEQSIMLESCPLSSARRSAVSTLSTHQRALYGASSVHAARGGTGGTSLYGGSSAGATPGGAASRVLPDTGDKEEEDCSIAAVLHNGAGEVGVALIRFPALSIAITQFGDTSTYAKLLALLYGRNPVEVLLAATTLEEPLTKMLVDNFKDEMTFTSVPRRFFSSEKGTVRLNQLKSSQETTLSIEDTDRYLCLAAANALLTYVEGISDMQFMPGSVHVSLISLDDCMDIPRTAARALHILCPSGGYTGSLRPATGDAARAAAPSATTGVRAGQQAAETAAASESAGGAFASNSRLETVPLVDALPRPCTPMGQRLLRSSLLQPLKDPVGIAYRQDAVAWLVADPVGRLDRLRRLLAGLSGGLDLEKMSALISYSIRFRPSPAAFTEFGSDGFGPGSSEGGGFGGPPRLNRQYVLLQEQRQQQHLATMYVERNKRVIACLMDYWTAAEVLMGLECTLQQLLPATEETASGVAGEEKEETAEDFSDEESVASGETEDDGITLHEEERRRPTGRAGRLYRSLSPSRATMHSSSDKPYLLLRLLTTLRACELATLRDTLQTHLDASVREPVRSGPGGGGGVDLISRPGVAPVHQQHQQQRLLASLQQQQQQQRRHGHGRRAGGKVDQHSRLTRLAFTVLAAPGSSLDVARSRYSEHIRRISEYHMSLCTAYRLSSLRLEADTSRLFCLSYAAAEDAKTVGGPFRAKFAGGNHFALFKRVLHVREQRRQQRSRQRWQQQHPWHASDVEDTREDEEDAEDDDQPMEEEAPAYLDPFLPGAALGGPQPSMGSGHGLGADGGRGGRRRARAARVRCTTDELTSLCQEATEYLRTIFAEEVKAAEELLAVLRGRLGCVHAMTEAVALLDMLLSFALYSFSHQCTRPVMWSSEGEHQEQDQGMSEDQSSTDADCLSVFTEFVEDDDADRKESLPDRSQATVNPCTGHAARAVTLHALRHPSQSPRQLAQLRGGGGAASLSIRATANTVTWEPGVSVLLLTGPNAAGKSTLLRILGQSYALAQSGCFLPCASASLRIVDRLCTHMLCDEPPSSQHSSQRKELMAWSEITHTATRDSLVLVDELGRSMLSQEGFSFAHAALLWLRTHVGCQTAFVTHFTDLAELPARLSGGMANAHFTASVLQASCARNGDSATGCRGPRSATASTRCATAHTLLPGRCEERAYGLKAARALGFYAPVLRLAEVLHDVQGPPSHALEEEQPQRPLGLGDADPSPERVAASCSDEERAEEAATLADV